MGAITVTDTAMRRHAATSVAEAFGGLGRDVTILAQGLDSHGQHVILTDTGRKYGRYACHYVVLSGLWLGQYFDDCNDGNAAFIKRAMR